VGVVIGCYAATDVISVVHTSTFNTGLAGRVMQSRQHHWSLCSRAAMSGFVDSMSLFCFKLYCLYYLFWQYVVFLLNTVSNRSVSSVNEQKIKNKKLQRVHFAVQKPKSECAPCWFVKGKERALKAVI
jgi:hypothetical protein